MGKENARMAVYGMAGIYLYIMAYKMITSLSTAGSDATLMIIFSIVFIVAGSGLVGLAIWDMHTRVKKRKEMEENPELIEETEEEA